MRLSFLSTWRTRLAHDTSRWGRTMEIVAFAGILALCTVLRVVSLGRTPRIVTADEVKNIQTAYRIIEGTGPGVFGLDWNPAPALDIYPLAWSIQLFGNSIADFRMFPVMFSLLAIVLFYLLARASMGPFPALAAAALLGTNLWFLHFSRTAWDNMDAAFVATGVCWTTTRALRPQRHPYVWWAAAGVFLAGGLYAYYSGRLLFLAVALASGVAVATRQAPLRRTALGFGLSALVAVALFAPMLPEVIGHWDDFNRRTAEVSVFKNSSLTDRGSWEIVGRNVGRNFRGLILQDGSQMDRGLWARYNPTDRAGLGVIATQLFWLGLVISIVRWRKTYTWWPFFVPLALVELFSTGTPDLARAIFFAPFYFLFIGMAFEEALLHLSRPVLRLAAVAAIVAVVALAATIDTRDYFTWQAKEATQLARLPGVDRCEFEAYREVAREAAANAVPVDGKAWEAERQIINCSPIIRNAAQPGGMFELGP